MMSWRNVSELTAVFTLLLLGGQGALYFTQEVRNQPSLSAQVAGNNASSASSQSSAASVASSAPADTQSSSSTQTSSACCLYFITGDSKFSPPPAPLTQVYFVPNLTSLKPPANPPVNFDFLAYVRKILFPFLEN